MLIKQADDRSGRLALLADLQHSKLLSPDQRRWLKDEWLRTQRGMQGERDAAHYIDSHYKDSELHAVIHDLRLVLDGEVAQIDHLIVNRMLHFYLFETKCFNGELEINEHGEFSVCYPGERRFGIESPLEQSLRHERVLAKVLDHLGITGRAGTKPSFHHAVLLHPKAIIRRPEGKRFNSDNVIKADQIDTWRQRYIGQEIGVVRILASTVNLQSRDGLKDMATLLARQHRRTDPLALPDFMKPRPVPPPPAPSSVVPASAPPRATAQPLPAGAGKPRAPLPPTAAASSPAAAAAPPTAPQADPPPEALKRKLVCVSCREKISFAEGKFCWNNEARFGGFQYCRQHQQ